MMNIGNVVEFTGEVPVRNRAGGAGRPSELLTALREHLTEPGRGVPITQGEDDVRDFETFARGISASVNRAGALAFPITVRTDKATNTVTVYRVAAKAPRKPRTPKPVDATPAVAQ